MQNQPSRDTLLRGVRAVRLTEFIDRSSKGTYQGHAYNGADLLLIVKLPNHAPQEFNAWADEALVTLKGKGCIVRRSEVANVSANPRPKEAPGKSKAHTVAVHLRR